MTDQLARVSSPEPPAQRRNTKETRGDEELIPSPHRKLPALDNLPKSRRQQSVDATNEQVVDATRVTSLVIPDARDATTSSEDVDSDDEPENNEQPAYREFVVMRSDGFLQKLEESKDEENPILVRSAK